MLVQDAARGHEVNIGKGLGVGTFISTGGVRLSRSIPDGVDLDLDMRATQRDVPHSRVRFATQA
jgi:hypothetical protein